jgi:hypothetical protein
MKETNAALERQVQELKGLLQSYWSTGVGLLISQVREEGAKFMHEGQNGYDEGQPPMDLEAAKGLLVALQEFPIYMTYCNKELRYVWISRTIKGTRPVVSIQIPLFFALLCLQSLGQDRGYIPQGVSR